MPSPGPEQAFDQPPTPGRGRGQRAGLTYDVVLAAAREVLTEQGLPAMTMRAIAERLGVTPNALYNHARTKEALLDDVLDGVLAQIQPSEAAPDPLAALEELMTSTYDVLLAHPDLAPLYLPRRRASGPNALRLSRQVIALLTRAGLPPDAGYEALRALVVHTFGFATIATRAVHDPGAEQPLTRPQLRANFTTSLHWLLTGILSPPA